MLRVSFECFIAILARTRLSTPSTVIQALALGHDINLAVKAIMLLNAPSAMCDTIQRCQNTLNQLGILIMAVSINAVLTAAISVR